MKSRPKILILSRNISPSSMPWNDIYGFLYKKSLVKLADPLEVRKSFYYKKIKSQELIDSEYATYFSAGWLQAFIHISKLSKKDKGLIVHYHNPILLILLIAVKLFSNKIRTVFTQHNYFYSFNLFQRILLLASQYFVDKYVFCSESSSDSTPIITSKGNKFSTISNCVPKSLIPFSRTSKANIRSDNLNPLKIIVVSRFVTQKNCFFLVDILSALKVPFYVEWYGIGPLKQRVLNYIKFKQIEESISLKGVTIRINIYKAMLASHIYLSTSLWEGLCVSDLEAFALGCECIMSDIPQRKELKENLGIELFPLNNFQCWVNKIECYKFNTLANLNNTQLINDFYSQEAMIRKYIDIYSEIS